MCQECAVNSLCHNCYVANYQMTCNIYKRDKAWCELQKIIFRANAYFAASRIHNKTFICNDEEFPYYLEAIVKINNEL